MFPLNKPSMKALLCCGATNDEYFTRCAGLLLHTYHLFVFSVISTLAFQIPNCLIHEDHLGLAKIRIKPGYQRTWCFYTMWVFVYRLCRFSSSLLACWLLWWLISWRRAADTVVRSCRSVFFFLSSHGDSAWHLSSFENMLGDVTGGKNPLLKMSLCVFLIPAPVIKYRSKTFWAGFFLINSDLWRCILISIQTQKSKNTRSIWL